jgi:hypothetical protein
MKKYTALQIIAVMQKKGYKLFFDGSPNLIGVRNSDLVANTFNDLLFDLRMNRSPLSLVTYIITTDPGTYWRKNPMRVDGTGIIKPGQYRGMWAHGMHKGLYPALVQVKPCIVIRDNNRDGILDVNSGVESLEIVGANCHRAADGVISKLVDKWSAGCQVHADGKRFTREFMPAMKNAAKRWGNSFTYTLLKECDFEELGF